LCLGVGLGELAGLGGWWLGEWVVCLESGTPGGRLGLGGLVSGRCVWGWGLGGVGRFGLGGWWAGCVIEVEGPGKLVGLGLGGG